MAKCNSLFQDKKLEEAMENGEICCICQKLTIEEYGRPGACEDCGGDMVLDRSPSPEPKKPDQFTQRMSLHLNGGSEYSAYVYDVFHNGKKTEIQRLQKHSRKQNKMLEHRFVSGDAEFDILAHGKTGLMEWLKSQVTHTSKDTDNK